MSSVTISLIMPVYNSELFLKQSILSVIEQKFKDWELIIIDSHSIDETANIIMSIDDNRIKYYNIDHNSVPQKRNFGLQLAAGVYIGFIDSDDRIASFKLLKQFEMFCDEIDCVGTNLTCIDSEDKILFNISYPENHQDIFCKSFYMNPIGFATLIIKKTKLIKHNITFDEKILIGSDHDFVLKLMDEGFKFYNIQQNLYFYRLHNKSISAQKNKDQRDLSYKLTMKRIETITSEYEKAKLNFLANYYFNSNTKKIKKYFNWVNHLKKEIMLLIKSSLKLFIKSESVVKFKTKFLKK